MPTIDIPDKICPHCNGTKWDISIRKESNTLRYRCTRKVREYRSKRIKNLDPQRKKEFYRKRYLRKKPILDEKRRLEREERLKHPDVKFYNVEGKVKVFIPKPWLRKTDKEKKETRKRCVKNYINSIKGTEKYINRRRRNEKSKRDRLTNSYLRKNLIISGFPKELITDEILNKYKIYIQTKRKLEHENRKNTSKETTTH